MLSSFSTTAVSGSSTATVVTETRGVIASAAVCSRKSRPRSSSREVSGSRRPAAWASATICSRSWTVAPSGSSCTGSMPISRSSRLAAPSKSAINGAVRAR